MSRNRNAATQAQMVKDSVIRKWGNTAWAMFGDGERERLLGYEFMCLLAAQENDGNGALDHYRDTARQLLGSEE